MSQDDDRQRTIDARIERIRERLKDPNMDQKLRGVLLAILDLLGDEL